jgi:transposase
VLVLTCCL